MARCDVVGVLLAAFGATTAALAPHPALGFGPLGHRVAGSLAEPELCAAARAEVASLGDGETLAELGLWADTVRSLPEWQRSAPWHYVNVDDAPVSAADPRAAALAAIRKIEHPPEGDVLAAIERFRRVLADRSEPPRARSEALRFLVHFVVDVHQPLHVGRAADRGGNTVDVRYADEAVNLHRFWDTDVFALRRESTERFVRRLRPAFRAALAEPFERDPNVWAAESLALRPVVYSFERDPPRSGTEIVLTGRYLAAAQAAVDDRLVLAAARLAATLNGLFCADPQR